MSHPKRLPSACFIIMPGDETLHFKLIQPVVLALALCITGEVAGAEARVGTWNTMRLGNGDQKSFRALAAVAAQVDVLAIQEVMNDQGIHSLETALEGLTREHWSTVCSNPSGSKNYLEQYCFLSRDSAVLYEDGAVSYLDRANIFMREPYSARFRSLADGETFTLATVHIVYGKSAADRTPELQELGRYWSWLEQIYPGEPIMLMGDFNMPPSDPAFTSLRAHAVPMVTQGATTLSQVTGRFANLYDHVWVNAMARSMISGVGIVNYPAMLGIDHAQARAHVSDHAPVFFQLGKSRLGPAVQMAYPQSIEQRLNHDASVAQAGTMRFKTETRLRSTPELKSSQAAPVHGNSSSQIYHLATGCPSYDKISPKNLVVFSSESEALTHSYRKAGNCR